MASSLKTWRSFGTIFLLKFITCCEDMFNALIPCSSLMTNKGFAPAVSLLTDTESHTVKYKDPDPALRLHSAGGPAKQ